MSVISFYYNFFFWIVKQSDFFLLIMFSSSIILNIISNRVLPLLQIYGFYIFPSQYFKKASQIQIFRILEPLVDFIFNFEVYTAVFLKTPDKFFSDM